MKCLHAVGIVHGKAVHSRRARVLATHLAELIPPDCSVLDVGCGDAFVDALLLKRRPDLRLSGVDVLVRADALIPVVAFDGSRLPFPDQSWDVVLLCDVLHHTPSPIEMLREAVRVARDCVVIKDHIVEGAFARYTLRFMDFVGNAPHGVAMPYNYLTLGQWEDAYRRTGLVPREVRHDLRLYPKWADVVFGRMLHFIGVYGTGMVRGEGRTMSPPWRR